MIGVQVERRFLVYCACRCIPVNAPAWSAVIGCRIIKTGSMAVAGVRMVVIAVVAVGGCVCAHERVRTVVAEKHVGDGNG